MRAGPVAETAAAGAVRTRGRETGRGGRCRRRARTRVRLRPGAEQQARAAGFEDAMAEIFPNVKVALHRQIQEAQ